MQRSAYADAIGTIGLALDLLQKLPHSRERLERELTLQLALGVPLMPAEGWSGARTGQAYARARELCSQLGETPQLFPALKGLAEFYLARAEYKAARELAEQLGHLAQNAHDPSIILEAHLSLGNTLLLVGEFALAQAHLEQGSSLYNRQQHRSHVFLYGHDPGCGAYSFWP
jgi:predicted ATPase